MCLCMCILSPYRETLCESPIERGLYKAPIQRELCKACRDLIHTYAHFGLFPTDMGVFYKAPIE